MMGNDIAVIIKPKVCVDGVTYPNDLLGSVDKELKKAGRTPHYCFMRNGETCVEDVLMACTMP